MRMEMHCFTDDTGHLAVCASVVLVHGVQHTSLHGFETVHDIRNSSLENNV